MSTASRPHVNLSPPRREIGGCASESPTAVRKKKARYVLYVKESDCDLTALTQPRRQLAAMPVAWPHRAPSCHPRPLVGRGPSRYTTPNLSNSSNISAQPRPHHLVVVCCAAGRVLNLTAVKAQRYRPQTCTLGTPYMTAPCSRAVGSEHWTAQPAAAVRWEVTAQHDHSIPADCLPVVVAHVLRCHELA